MFCFSAHVSSITKQISLFLTILIGASSQFNIAPLVLLMLLFMLYKFVKSSVITLCIDSEQKVINLNICKTEEPRYSEKIVYISLERIEN